jgi:hypothetical protein
VSQKTQIISYLSLPCTKKILRSPPHIGGINMGARIIAFACKLDGLNLEKAKATGKRYYKRCAPHDFNFLEVLRWVRWVYGKDKIFWNCTIPKDLNICNESKCPLRNLKQFKRGERKLKL